MQTMPKLVALCLALPWPALAAGPSALDALKERPKGEAPPVAAAGPVALSAEQEEAACPVPAVPDGSFLQRKVFSWRTTYEHKSGDALVGRLVAKDGGYAYEDAAGRTLAKSRGKGTRSGWDVTVTDCRGREIGSIVETDEPWGGDREFVVRAPGGGVVASSGRVGYQQGRIVLAGPSGIAAILEETHWFYDRWTLRLGPGADARLIVMVLAYNDSADSRESSRRQQERERDRPERPDPRDR